MIAYYPVTSSKIAGGGLWQGGCHHKPLTMDEVSGCSGRRVTCADSTINDQRSGAGAHESMRTASEFQSVDKSFVTIYHKPIAMMS
jgi:hypothetical protein